MLMSESSMGAATSQVRSIKSTLDGLLSELVSAGVWSGPDADRFARDWNDEVAVQLVNAAATMDRISFETLE
jgi:hypothetical protein